MAVACAAVFVPQFAFMGAAAHPEVLSTLWGAVACAALLGRLHDRLPRRVALPILVLVLASTPFVDNAAFFLVGFVPLALFIVERGTLRWLAVGSAIAMVLVAITMLVSPPLRDVAIRTSALTWVPGGEHLVRIDTLSGILLPFAAVLWLLTVAVTGGFGVEYMFLDRFSVGGQTGLALVFSNEFKNISFTTGTSALFAAFFMGMYLVLFTLTRLRPVPAARRR